MIKWSILILVFYCISSYAHIPVSFLLGFSVFQYVGSRHYGYSLAALVSMVAGAYQHVAVALVVYNASRFQAQVSRILILKIICDAS